MRLPAPVRLPARSLSCAAIGCIALATVLLQGSPVAGQSSKLPLPGSAMDFFLPGTQPDPSQSTVYPIDAVLSCNLCHGLFQESALNPLAEPYRNWTSSMMGQSARDPVFYAALTIANQDVSGAGALCLRCHTPAAFIGGRADPPDGSAIGGGWADFDGVNCNFCHRLVNPTYVRGQSPAEDLPILADLAKEGLLPLQADGARYVIDPQDARRGPRHPDAFLYNPHSGVPIYQSPFHRKSDLCGTCHDVSNPALSRQKDGSYQPNAPDAPHPTMNKYDMMPDQRTFSEWQQSQFAKGGVQMFGRFGGAHPTGIMESCQDCHMPKVVGPGCILESFPVWPDLPQHTFAGANSWVLRAVDALYPDYETGLTPQLIEEAVARNVAMLRAATDLAVSQVGTQLKVRLTNFAGHKFPTGYQEGRRAWINVKFLDSADQIVAERGHYDYDAAELTSDTKVYEVHYGLDRAQARRTGLPAGESFHLVLNNTVIKDNRIPPIGATLAGLTAIQGAPVGASYADGQNWDDTSYYIPQGAVRALVTAYHQTSSREYMEFLRDNNFTDERGKIAFGLWEQFGKSAPVDIDSAVLTINPAMFADLNGDGHINGFDLAILLGQWGRCPTTGPCPADYDGNHVVNGLDLAYLLGSWTG